MTGSSADSAGVPWAGRRFEPSTAPDDDGSAPDAFTWVMAAFREGRAGQADVVDVLRRMRLLVPLVAEAGDTGVASDGPHVDTTQELSIVTVRAPDGRAALPVFSSVDAMRTWNPEARPVPADATRVALSAGNDGAGVVIVDPTTPTEFAIRRPAIRAIALQQPWTPSFADPEVASRLGAGVNGEPAITQVALAPGDPAAALAGPETDVHLSVRPGLTRPQLDALVERVTATWAADGLVAERVDSLRVLLHASTEPDPT